MSPLDNSLPRGTPSAPTRGGRRRAVPANVTEGWLPRERVLRRLVQLIAGLVAYGASMALMLRSGLGLDPWDVFHQGTSRLTGMAFGLVVIVVGVAVLVAWIPLRQRPGLGTVLNAILIGLAVQAILAVLPAPRGIPVRIAFLAGGVLLNGLATGAYIGARLGPGPRDGLMTGWVARTGASIRLTRTAIEATVLLTGILMGGTWGAGTVLYAVAIGPLAHLFIPLLTVPPAGRNRAVVATAPVAPDIVAGCRS